MEEEIVTRKIGGSPFIIINVMLRKKQNSII